jgi:diadenosine tetraphosphatase ApaH/serine/threonine PP2A family protein phosphatase
MRLAILSDIHGNREALTAVLSDQAARGCDGMMILGDIVGYGPDPEWCCDRVMALAASGAVVLKGNHDEAIVTGAAGMNSSARKAIEWTRPRLSTAQVDFLAALPMRADRDGAAFVHASAEAPGDWIYVTNETTAAGSMQASRARVTFCGHVHVPALYSADLRGMVAATRVKIGMPMPLLRSRRWMAVVGSVGQPRDRNPAAGYAIFDEGTQDLTFRRVPYDCGAVAIKVRAAGLPEALALRLLSGD